MITKTTPKGWMLTLLSALFLLSGLTASCSKDDKDDKGGGIAPDPNIPTLSEIKYDLSQQAVIIPEAVTKQLISVDTLGHKLILPASAEMPEVGQCLIFNTPTKDLPDGLLAKVKSVKEGANGYEIIYEDAQLKDAFKNIDIPEQYIPLGQYVEHVYDADGKEVKFSTREKTRASGVKSFEIILPEIGWKLGKGIELTPKMSIDLLMRYVFMFGDYELSYAGVKFDADITVGADLNSTKEEAKLFEKKFHILTIVCGAIPIGPVLLTPSIDVQGVVRAEGKITLEASISYERTLHAGMVYQKGAGIKPTCELEPEAPDALKFTFGPKFEGGIAYGLIMGGNIGVFGKTLHVRNRLTVMKKETISGKIDMAAFTGTGEDCLTPFTLDASGTQEAVDNNILRTLDYALKWKFSQFEDLMYNQSIGITVGWDLTTLGVDVASTTMPEMSIPISSVPICPQVKIEEKDFLTSDENDVTLKFHHTKKSVLDDITEFRAEFKRVGAKPDESPIVKYFDFDDEKRSLLVAEIKGADVTSTANATLNGEDNYDITVYMSLLGLDIPIFEGKANVKDLRIDAQSIDYSADIEATASDGTKVSGIITWGGVNGFVIDRLGQGERFESKDIVVTPIGNKGEFLCTATYNKTYDDARGKTIKESATLDLTIDQPKNGTYGIAKKLVFNFVQEVYYQYYDFTVKIKENVNATDIPVSWTSESGRSVVWSGGADEGVKIIGYSHSSVVEQDGDIKQNLVFSKPDKYKLRIGVEFPKD